MYQMVVLVLDDLEKTAAILDAWEQAGVSGITILESTGIGRIRRLQRLRDDMPLMPTLSSFLRSREEQHRTLFSLIDDEALVDRIVELTDEITGGLDAPNKGILFVLPVLRAVGISDMHTVHEPESGQETTQ